MGGRGGVRLGVPALAYHFDLTGTELDPSPVLRAMVRTFAAVRTPAPWLPAFTAPWLT